MSEHIEREAVLAKAAPVEGCFSDMVSAYDVAAIPAADVATVVHGRWKWKRLGCVECSRCHKENNIRKFSYCPNCGARMDGE